MIVGLVIFIFCCLGIYGYYSDNYVLTYIGFLLNLIDNIICVLSGTQKNMTTLIFACIIGYFVISNSWLGVSLAACYENTIFYVIGIIVSIIALSKNK